MRKRLTREFIDNQKVGKNNQQLSDVKLLLGGGGFKV